MIKKYLYEHKHFPGTVEFSVDEKVFTIEKAKEFCEYWLIDKDNPIDGALRFIATLCLRTSAVPTGKSSFNIVKALSKMKGIIPLDGSQGVELLMSWCIDIEEDDLNLTITDLK